MNKCIKYSTGIFLLILLINIPVLNAQDTAAVKSLRAAVPEGFQLNDIVKIKPANPDESSEAVQLLKFLYSISGKKTLSGIHNYLRKMSESTDSAFAETGKYPAIWGGDFGFADSTHDTDNIKYRASLVDEIKKQYARGEIIIMTYHEANPVMGEPCPFRGGVESKLSDQQWKDLITPGTALYNAWQKQMDLFASYLLQLRDAHIPILFRPYHEMNGNWFWWGARPGDSGYVALWRQLFNYFTKDKKLNNILWVWTSDRPWDGVEKYYPGDDYVDALGSDIYPVKDTNVVFRQEWYDKMKKLANGKPLGLSENSVIPSEEILKIQPWTWFMSWTYWALKANPKDELKKIYNSDLVLTVENLPDWKNGYTEPRQNSLNNSLQNK